MDPNRIRDFVRGRLGCQCEEAVFQAIQIHTGPGLPAGVAVEWRIGGRLLIWLAPVPGLDLPRLVQAGRQVRDRDGFNRWRLVSAPDLDPAALERAFLDLAGDDRRLHLHLLDPGAFRELLDPHL